MTNALRAAYLSITPPTGPPAAGSLGGGTTLATTSIGAPTGSPAVAGLNYFVAGVYTSGSTIVIAGDVTLDGGGDPNAVFVFQAGSSITATPGAPTPAAHARILLDERHQGVERVLAGRRLGHDRQLRRVERQRPRRRRHHDADPGHLVRPDVRGCLHLGRAVFDNNVVSIPGNVNAPAGCL